MKIDFRNNKRFILLEIIIIVFIIILVLTFFVKNNLKSSYEIIGSDDKKEYNITKQKCKKIIEYLEKKYHEKFHIIYEWSYEELSRTNSIQAYSYKNPNKIFSVWETKDGFNDRYIMALSQENTYKYFYEIFRKYNIDSEDFELVYFDVDNLKICKENFNKPQCISFEIYLDINKFYNFRKDLPDISKELNNSVSYKDAINSVAVPNFSIKLYTKEEINYNDTNSDDSFVYISIYDNHYSVWSRLSSEKLFKEVFPNTYVNF